MKVGLSPIRFTIGRISAACTIAPSTPNRAKLARVAAVEPLAWGGPDTDWPGESFLVTRGLTAAVPFQHYLERVLPAGRHDGADHMLGIERRRAFLIGGRPRNRARRRRSQRDVAGDRLG